MVDNVIKKSVTSTGEEMSLLGNSKKVILALQHLIAMFGATVLVPIITGLDPSIALFSAGIGTLIFHACTKGKVPVFLGSSFAFIPVILTVKELYNGDLSYAQGGMVVAGLIYILVSFLIKKIGVERIQRYLAPQVVGPMIIVIGMNMLPVAFGMAKENLFIAAITLGTALTINFKGKGFIKQLAILIAVIVGYTVSYKIGIVNTGAIHKASILAMPSFRLPKFDLGAIAIIAPVVLAVFMEHLGDITTNGQVVGKNFIEDPGLNRTLLGDGLATTVATLIGGPANTTYGENTGVLAITKNYDPSILRLAAVFAVGLAFIAKIGASLSTIPTSVMGGISLMLFSMISLIGVKTIRNQEVKFNWKNIIVMGTILTLGLGGEYLSKKLGITIGIPINENVKIAGLSFAALIGIIINAVLNRK
ncbi:uracil-xanthine permease family protein [Tissierella praeacuta]|uniref:Uracil permease n=1 Tax=Tissierella praeacuta DSM 18095 TaxID=1123404 RepID=A0A1M4XXA3_9FIRM|nr:uracil-xanthine permease family protein [Tissierella praeacuta]TCU69783.1 uracil permease [Tissierella praeacuta]SHE97976.1 uracil permease [Tissierella praeacuta DSM 18095]SUP03445.1 Uracil transporter [Tissierella praeacuta]